MLDVSGLCVIPGPWRRGHGCCPLGDACCCSVCLPAIDPRILGLAVSKALKRCLDSECAMPGRLVWPDFGLRGDCRQHRKFFAEPARKQTENNIRSQRLIVMEGSRVKNRQRWKLIHNSSDKQEEAPALQPHKSISAFWFV